MNASARNKLLLIASLAMLSLRALTPDGYMPGSQGSGLVFELCPSGLPAGVVQALTGGEHHHHGHGGDNPGAAADTEQCPIGHMLASAAAVDTSTPPQILPDASLYDVVPVTILSRSTAIAYRSRAPPA